MSPDYGFSPVGSGFEGENPPTDLPFKGSGGGDPPPIVTGAGQPVLRLDRTVFAGGSGTGFPWTTLTQTK